MILLKLIGPNIVTVTRNRPEFESRWNGRSLATGLYSSREGRVRSVACMT